MQGYEDYQKRSFCRDVKCPVQISLDEHVEGSDEYREIKKQCSEGCLRSADNFLDWLKERSFIVTKIGETPRHDQIIVNDVKTENNTAWLFHKAITEKNYTILREIKK